LNETSVGEILDQFELKIRALLETEVGKSEVSFENLFKTFTSVDITKIGIDLGDKLPETINVFFGRLNDKF